MVQYFKKKTENGLFKQWNLTAAFEKVQEAKSFACFEHSYVAESFEQ